MVWGSLRFILPPFCVCGFLFCSFAVKENLGILNLLKHLYMIFFQIQQVR